MSHTVTHVCSNPCNGCLLQCLEPESAAMHWTVWMAVMTPCLRLHIDHTAPLAIPLTNELPCRVFDLSNPHSAPAQLTVSFPSSLRLKLTTESFPNNPLHFWKLPSPKQSLSSHHDNICLFCPLSSPYPLDNLIYISYKYLLKKVSCSDLMLSFSAWFWRLWLASVCFYMLNYNQLYVFLFCSWGSPFLLWTTFCKNLLHHDPSVLGGPAWHGSKLYKAVIHMIILVSFLWLCFLFQRLGDYGSYFFCLPSDGWE